MYVLIHGGFHNNKCWHDVEQILRKNGKKVTSVLLPGHNETDIERLKDINVTTCVESIINQIGETDEKLTLVFHSMAGIFIYDTYKKIGKEQIESIGTPTWWYTMAPAVLTFLTTNDFTGKTVIPFMTNGGWPGHVIKDMKENCKGAAFAHEMQIQFDSKGKDHLETSEEVITEWIGQINTDINK